MYRDAADLLGSGTLLSAEPHAVQDIHPVLVHSRLQVSMGQPGHLVHAGRRRHLQHRKQLSVLFITHYGLFGGLQVVTRGGQRSSFKSRDA